MHVIWYELNSFGSTISYCNRRILTACYRIRTYSVGHSDYFGQGQRCLLRESHLCVEWGSLVVFGPGAHFERELAYTDGQGKYGSWFRVKVQAFGQGQRFRVPGLESSPFGFSGWAVLGSAFRGGRVSAAGPSGGLPGYPPILVHPVLCCTPGQPALRSRGARYFIDEGCFPSGLSAKARSGYSKPKTLYP